MEKIYIKLFGICGTLTIVGFTIFFIIYIIIKNSKRKDLVTKKAELIEKIEKNPEKKVSNLFKLKDLVFEIEMKIQEITKFTNNIRCPPNCQIYQDLLYDTHKYMIEYILECFLKFMEKTDSAYKEGINIDKFKEDIILLLSGIYVDFKTTTKPNETMEYIYILSRFIYILENLYKIYHQRNNIDIDEFKKDLENAKNKISRYVSVGLDDLNDPIDLLAHLSINHAIIKTFEDIFTSFLIYSFMFK